MNKKGFTLLELLGVIVILSIIASFAFTNMVNMNKKESENQRLYDTIYMAAESYIYDNYSNFTDLDEEKSVRVNVIDLINNGYLSKNTRNPKTDSTFTSENYILVERKNNKQLTFMLE